MSGRSHNRIKVLAQSLALVAGLALSTAAYAVQTLTQTLTFTPTLFGTGPTVETETFNQFDTLGGRFVLQSVEVDWSTAFNSNITATSGSGNTRTLQTTASFTSSLSTAGNLFGFSNTVSGTSPNYVLAGQGTTATFLVSGAGIGAFDTATNLTPFLGTGTIAVTNTLSNIQGAISRVQGGNGNQSLTGGTALGSMSVVYYYIDLLPDPGTWATMIIGFGMVGASMRRRRALAAA